MNPAEFLTHLQSEEGWFAVVGIRSGDVKQTLVATLEEAEETIGWYASQQRDVYFGVAKYKNGSSRTKENVRTLKAFWLDIDCGPTKAVPDPSTGRPGGYLDQSEALSALRSFCRTVGLPRPTIIDSGRGLHVYWPLKEEVTRADWEPVASRLREICHAQEFYVDDKVFEVARILRVPGTYNYKGDEPIPVKVLNTGEPTSYEDFQKLLGADTTRKASIFDPNWTASPQDEARMRGVGYSFRRIMQRTARGEGCNQLSHAYANRSSISYYEWFYALSVAALCEDADTATHMMSEGYPGYDRDTVDKKVATIRKSTSCAKFREANPGLCDGCPHFGEILGPRDLGKVAKEAKSDTVVVEDEDGEPIETYVIPTYPQPYYRAEGGGIWKMPPKDEPEAEPICIYENDIYLVKRMMDTDPEDGQKMEVVLIRLHLAQDGVREFTVPFNKLTDVKTMRKVLTGKGVGLIGGAMDRLMDYLVKSFNEMQKARKAEIMRQQFGWVANNSRFVIGDQEITADGNLYSPPSKVTAKLAKFIGPTGSLDKWKEVAALYGQPGMEPHAFAALSAFGAPLLRFLNQTGAVINLYSPRSGTGKTTILNFINSVYGHPKELRMKKDDTINGRLMWVGILNNLPATMDELTNMSSKEFSDFLYALSNGKGKERMQASTNELRENNTTWQTITVSTSNAAFAEKLSVLKGNPEGELMRLFEYPIDLVETPDTANTKQLFDRILMENYGHAGPIFIRYLVSNLELVMKWCEQIQAKIDYEVRLEPKERFWSANVAVNIVGGLIAKRLGLIDWDIDAIYQWACQRVTELRKDTSAPLSGIDQIVGDYLYRNMQNILVVDGLADRRSGMHPLPKREPKGNLTVRIEPDTKLIYLAAKPFKEFCVEFQVNYTDTVRQLSERGLLVNRALKRLATGTNVSAPPVHCLCLKAEEDFVSVESYFEPEDAD